MLPIAVEKPFPFYIEKCRMFSYFSKDLTPFLCCFLFVYYTAHDNLPLLFLPAFLLFLPSFLSLYFPRSAISFSVLIEFAIWL